LNAYQQPVIELQIGFCSEGRGWPPSAVLEIGYAWLRQTQMGISVVGPEEMPGEATITVQQISGIAEYRTALLVILL
jgi:hypothetical protein